jgi:superfamily II DNA or RNA helicase
MKAVLSNRIYLYAIGDLRASIIKELTYELRTTVPNMLPEIIHNYIVVSPTLLSLPIGRQDLIPKDYEIVDKRTHVPCSFPDIKYTLRPSQELAVELVNDNYVINALPGYGKTVTAIAIAQKLKQKTLVITHTVALRDQWVKEVNNILGIKAGIIGSGKFNIDSIITIANVQSLIKHFDKLTESFGLIINDEVHHVPASTFVGIVDKSKARYKVGLSGTLERKDGRHVYMLNYFSTTNIYRPEEENTLKPSVTVIKTNIDFSSNTLIPWANRVTQLINTPEYVLLLKNLALIMVAKGHKVLLVADRLELLERLQVGINNSMLITGNIGNRDTIVERLSTDMDIIFATTAIFKEGISVNMLSCLILGTPINNDPMLIQLVGRIQRMHPNKLAPEVIDISLKGNTARRQSSARENLYFRKGWDIKYVNDIL